MALATNYYIVSQTFYKLGYTYKCRTDLSGMVTLFNKKNTHTFDDNFKYKDGTPVEDSKITLGEIALFEDDNWTKPRCISIVDSAFSESEKLRVRGQEFEITMKIEPDSGRVIEVDFTFFSESAFVSIPVSTYRKIEVALKKQIWFTPTTVGKKLETILASWTHKVK